MMAQNLQTKARTMIENTIRIPNNCYIWLIFIVESNRCAHTRTHYMYIWYICASVLTGSFRINTVLTPVLMLWCAIAAIAIKWAPFACSIPNKHHHYYYHYRLFWLFFSANNHHKNTYWFQPICYTDKNLYRM